MLYNAICPIEVCLRIWESLAEGEKQADDIARGLDVDIESILGELTMMEVSGLIENFQGVYRRKGG